MIERILRNGAIALFVVLLSLLLVACRNQTPPKSAMEMALTESPGVQRFVSVESDGSVALDTRTGRLCKTWEWNYPGAKMGTELDALRTCSKMLQNDDEWVEHIRSKREGR
jgi:hypothetical protein